MEKRHIIIVLESITIVVLLLLLVMITSVENKSEYTTKFSDVSPCGNYSVSVIYKGTTGTFGDARYTVNLRYNDDENLNDIISSVEVFVADDGKSGSFETEWHDTYFLITFDGDEQNSNTIVLPFTKISEVY